MISKILLTVGSALLLSGCSLPMPASLTGGSSAGSIWKSFDSGETFLPKVSVDEKKRITSADVLSFVFHPTDPQIIYIGTKESGIFKTSDGGEHWEQVVFPPIKTYGIAIDQGNGDRLYASGGFQDIAKLYRSDDAGKNWKEIYTEPGKGTVITALGSNPNAPEALYAGTSAGVVIKSTNGGETWRNIYLAKGAVTKILFHKGAPEMVTLLVATEGVVFSTDGGTVWSDSQTQALAPQAPGVIEAQPATIGSLATDASNPSVLFAGATNGLFRSDNNGKTWRAIDIIESSKKFPVRAVAVNPADSKEIIYAAGNAFYRSIDGGTKWATTQLAIDRAVGSIDYEPKHPEIIYFTLRKF